MDCFKPTLYRTLRSLFYLGKGPRRRQSQAFGSHRQGRLPFVQTLRWGPTSLLGFVGLIVSILPLTEIAGAAEEPSQLSVAVRQQIQALLNEKATWTTTQHKISSRLLHARKIRLGQPIIPGLSRLRTGVTVRPDGTTEVDIRSEVSESVLAQLEAIGGTVINAVPRHQAIRARIPLDQVERFANLPQVRFIRPAEKMMTNSHDSGAINVSEGDVAHRANITRATFGADGSGITIGVLSNGVDSLAVRQASGDLPSTVTVLSGQEGSGDEGTAMLEIVHDLAPGANLMFATAFSGQASFAANIEALRVAGADIIVDDVFYFAEPAFQDGIIAEAVNTVTANGALYFSSAGNSGNLNDGTSGVWEGDFSPTTAPLVFGAGVTAHAFGAGANGNHMTKDPPFLITLQWSDPAGGSTNDYDLFLLNHDGTAILDASTNIQNGTQDPYEEIDSQAFNDLNNLLVIVQNTGASSRFLHLNTHRGELAIGTDGQTSGHATAVDAFGVAAVNVATAGGGAFVGGIQNPVESFSSDGPRRIFYHPNGTPITPGDVSSTGGTIRPKPDLAAADGVATSTPGFNPFFGTSAAAPHAAAISALILQAATPADVRGIFQATALDIEVTGIDRDSGYGLVDAWAAVNSVVVPATFQLDLAIMGSGTGVVTSTPAGIICPGTCTNGYLANTTVVLAATPSPDSTFEGWQGCDQVIGENCQVTMASAKNVTATFSIVSHPLTVNITSIPTYLIEVALHSEPGDYIGQGQNWIFTNSDFRLGNPATTFDATGDGMADRVSLYLLGIDIQEFSALSFDIATDDLGINLIPGLYENAQRYLFEEPGHPGLDFSMESRGCNKLNGKFTVLEVEFDQLTLLRLRANFEQHCDRRTAALFGSIYFQSVSGDGTGVVISEPPGINCVGDCTEEYEKNSVVILRAIPDPGSTFSGWSGAGCSGLGTCAITMSEAQNVSAVFSTTTISTHSLTVTNDGGGTVTSFPPGISCPNDCSEPYPVDTEVTLTATPNEGTVFAGWGGNCVGTGPCKMTMSEANTVTATFSTIPANTYPLMVSTRDPQVPFIELNLHSEPGDFIGQGQDYLLTNAEGSLTWMPVASDFTLDGMVDSLRFNYNYHANTSQWWSLTTATNYLGNNLEPGFYDNARRAVPGTVGLPGLTFSLNSRGCNTLTGNFNVAEAVFDYSASDPQALLFRGNFEQHCEGASPAIFGDITFNAIAGDGEGTVTADVGGIDCGMGLYGILCAGHHGDSNSNGIARFNIYWVER